MITTLRHLKLWKKPANASSNPTGPGLESDRKHAPGHGAPGHGSMFRSPSSDSGYSDVPGFASAQSKRQQQQLLQVKESRCDGQISNFAPTVQLQGQIQSIPQPPPPPNQTVDGPNCDHHVGLENARSLGVPATRPPSIRTQRSGEDLRPNVIVLVGGQQQRQTQRVADGQHVVWNGDLVEKRTTAVKQNGCVLSPIQAFAVSPSSRFNVADQRFVAGTPSGAGAGLTMTMATTTMVSVEAFFEFVRRRDVDSIRYALRDAHYDIDSQDADGRTALHVALVHGIVDNDMDIVRLLIGYGANVNIKDESPQRESCLHVALRLGHVEAVQLVLESPTFDVIRCDALQKTRMLPDSCLIDDVYKPLPADSDCTLTKRRSFGDQYMMFCRQDTADYIENNFPTAKEPIRDMVIVQDERLPLMTSLVRRVDEQTLTTLYIVDCRVQLDEESLSSLQLRTLVLSQTHLRHLPVSLFSMTSLETLKVDRNRLTEIPAEVSRLTALRTFCCDSQRPRLRSLPVDAVTQLTRLEVLSFADNRISDISWIPAALPRLRLLRADRNSISRLPGSLADLRNLAAVDVTHNRLDRIPSALAPLVRRLFRFEYFNLTLRPRHIRRSRARLIAHLELENFLQSLHQFHPHHYQQQTLPSSAVPVVGVGSSATSSPVSGHHQNLQQQQQALNHRVAATMPTGKSCPIEEEQRPTVRDITLGIVGESHSGKTTLIAALKDELGVSRIMTETTGRPTGGGGSSSSSAAAGAGQSSSHHSGSYNHSMASSAGGYEVHQFEMRSPFISGLDGGIGSGGSSSCDVCALVLGNEVLDSFSQQVHVDLYLLVVDLTALELHNGSHHLFARHVARLQMWLQALYELSADTPVLIVGTHAEQVRSMTFADIWRILDDQLEQSRPHHGRRYCEARHPACLLCHQRSAAFRQPHSAKSGTKSTVPPLQAGGYPIGTFQSSTSGVGAAAQSSSSSAVMPTSALVAPPTVAGFVDLSFSQYQYIQHQQQLRQQQSTAAASAAVVSATLTTASSYRSAHSTSGSDTPPNISGTLLMNGHASLVDPSQSGTKATTSVVGGGINSGRTGSTSNFRFPHVVGYYETDCRKPFPKDSKLKSNLGVDQLKTAIVRLTGLLAHSGATVDGCGGGGAAGIPASWMAFVRHLSSIREQAPNVPFVAYDEAVSMARSFDIAPCEVSLMLQYFHRRGRLVYFCDDPLLSRLVVVSPSWFVQTIGRAVDCFDRSLVDGSHLLQHLTDRELERQLQKAMCPTTVSTSAQWLLAALQRLDLCLPVGDCPTLNIGPSGLLCCSPGHAGSAGGSAAGPASRLFVFPNLLESGSPSQDVWPDVPEWDEKQITCDFRIRSVKPGMFADFMRRLNDEGRRWLEIVPDPVPVFLSHHVVFFAAIDLGGCDDCCTVRRRLRAQSTSGGSVISYHRRAGSSVRRGPGNMGGSAGSVICAGGYGPPGSEDSSAGGGGMCSGGGGGYSGTGDCSTDDDLMDDVMHKVHIQLNAGLDAVRIQVRGVSPCCTMKAVLGFLELYLDDVPDEHFLPGGCSSSGTGYSGQGGSADASAASSDRASLNSVPASAASPSGGSGSAAGGDDDGGELAAGGGCDVPDHQRQFFLLCPKCVLLRHSKPERIQYQAMTARRKAICSRWHNLGSWSRAATGDYRYSTVELHQHLQSGLSTLPDYEHPRLVLVLPPSQPVSGREWYVFSRMRLLEGFEAHFLCENPAYWHLTEDSGYRMSRPPGAGSGGSRSRRVAGNDNVAALLSLALPMVQVVQGVNEHPQTCRLLAPVVADLVRMYDYLRAVDAHMIADPYAWLSKNKDRVVAMLTKVLANASDGLPDLYFKAGSSITPDSIFQAPSRASRLELAKFLRVEASSGRFGALRPIYVGREIRWVCDAHYEELRSIPSK